MQNKLHGNIQAYALGNQIALWFFTSVLLLETWEKVLVWFYIKKYKTNEKHICCIYFII